MRRAGESPATLNVNSRWLMAFGHETDFITRIGGAMPKGIQRKRTKGWRMPDNSVSVCRPSKFGNPFNSSRPGWAVDMFRDWLTLEEHADIFPERRKKLLGSLQELKGKDLACFCKDGEPCHRDILLELANR